MWKAQTRFPGIVLNIVAPQLPLNVAHWARVASSPWITSSFYALPGGGIQSGKCLGVAHGSTRERREPGLV